MAKFQFGGGSGGGSSSTPSPQPEEDEPGFFGKAISEAGELLSNLPRAAIAFYGAPFREGEQVAKTAIGLATGENLGYRAPTTREAPDLLDDIGLSTLGDITDAVEQRSPIVRDMVAPLTESVLTSFGQGFSGATEGIGPDLGLPSFNPLAPADSARLVQQRLGSLFGREVDPDATFLEAALPEEGIGGEFRERIIEDREMREEQAILPFIEDVGNISLIAGGAGVGARVAGAGLTRAGVAGAGARLSSVGRTASAVARGGLNKGTANVALAGERVSSTGAALGQIARPLRTALGPLAKTAPVKGVRQAAFDKLEANMARVRAAGDEPWRAKETLARFLDPERSEFVNMAQADQAKSQAAVSSLRRALTEPSNRADAMRRINNLGKVLDDDTLARVQAVYRERASADPDLPSELPNRSNLREDMPPKQALAILDSIDEAGVQLRRDLLPGEMELGADVRQHALDLLRLSLHEEVMGMEPGTLLNTLRSVHELDANAYLIGELLPALEQITTPEEFRRLLSMDENLEQIRFLEQSLPRDLDPESLARVQQAARSYRPYQGGVEGTRARNDLIPEGGQVGSRLDAEGNILPEDAPTRFDDTAPNAVSARRLTSLLDKAEKLELDLKKLDDAIDANGGLDNLEQNIRLAQERAGVYRTMMDTLNEVTQQLDVVNDPAAINSVLSMMDDMIELGSNIDDIVAGGTPQYVRNAQNAAREAVATVKEVAEVRAAELASGGTPLTLTKQRLQIVARVAREVTPDNAADSVRAIRAALQEVGELVNADQTTRSALGRQTLNRLERLVGTLDDAVRSGDSAAIRSAADALSEPSAVTRDLIRRVDEADPLQQSIRDLRSAQQELTRQRNRHLKSSRFSQRARRSQNTAAERMKLQEATTRATARLAEARAEWAASTAAVPRAARTLVTFANEIVPEVAATLRETGDPRYIALADALEQLPRNLEEVQNARVIDPETGVERPLQVTYTPDIPEARDPRTRGSSQGSRLSDDTPGFQRRQRVVDQPMVEDPYELARQQAVSTVETTLKQQFQSDFRERFTRSAEQVLREAGKWEDNLSTSEIARRMKQLGYTEYKPNDLFGPFRQSRFSSPEGRWTKNHISEMAKSYFSEGGDFSDMLRMSYDPALNTWKAFVLALAPRWHVNNAIGNLALATFAGKVALRDYYKFMNTALDLQRRAKSSQINNDLRILKPGPATTVRFARGKLKPGDVVDTLVDFGGAERLRDLFDNSLLSGERLDQNAAFATLREYADSPVEGVKDRLLQPVAGAVADVGSGNTRAARLVNASYRANSAIDDMNRALVYLVKGFEDPVTGRADLTRVFDPDEGARNAIKAFGAYNDMSPFERRVLRRIFPFYTWMRHISGVLARHITDINEIDRTILFGHLIEVLGEPDEEEELLPEWASMQVFTGYNDAGIPQFFNPRGADPFSEAPAPFQAAGALLTGDFREALRFGAQTSGPVGSYVYEQATGLDALQGNRLSGIEGPQGQAPEPSIVNTAFESLPQARILREYVRDFTGTNQYVRADDDSTLSIVKDPATTRTTTELLMRFLGVPVSTPLPVEAIRESELDRERRYRNSVQRNRERLSERRPGNSLDQISGRLSDVFGG